MHTRTSRPFRSLKPIGFSNVIASGNPTPYFEPIVSTASPNLTPFGDSDFLLFEEADSFLALEDDPTSSEVDPTYQDPKELKLCEAKTVESSVDEPPEVELKELPPHLEYAFLEGDDKLPGYDPSRASQRRIENPHIKTTVKNEIYEGFPLETLGSVSLSRSMLPHWFADFDKLPVGIFVIKGMTSQKKIYSSRMSNFISEMIPSCLSSVLIRFLLDTPTTRMPLTLSLCCDICQRQDKILRQRDEMPQNSIKFAKSLTSGALILWGLPSFKRKQDTFCGSLTTCKNGLQAKALPH
ncbi:hypothetical protein Tco_1502901 [Tanacetum coccineum]